MVLNPLHGRKPVAEIQFETRISKGENKGTLENSQVATHKNALIVNEWPDSCMYYNIPRVWKWFKRHHFESVVVDGCMTGLTSVNAKDFRLPVLKTWRLMTNKPQNLEPMRRAFKCNHKHHARCEGRNTKMTETYTREFCRIAHLCFFN